ncbi:hypothetical protein TTHERM_000136237 (macronuclear) [Tetrahymena thermophila SB210]|uniref:Uncharacterized protein n=1 Tax=Tetrahymena thermophila (strain SB210) TaxID=312017 RepID=W7X819_TETTS|nr:hypothetical protein TTHERM_000136237 [Tetrahymena thermophila SB210]EWS73487.1 hypothetical protein TTHERM_000136237 [Tetrahymena thermophila SB210]|eukprot:XP_012653969.1 hypothetical protein TTHERM_000136237 [Tetrahymena thermophila SB210]
MILNLSKIFVKEFCENSQLNQVEVNYLLQYSCIYKKGTALFQAIKYLETFLINFQILIILLVNGKEDTIFSLPPNPLNNYCERNASKILALLFYSIYEQILRDIQHK